MYEIQHSERTVYMFLNACFVRQRMTVLFSLHRVFCMAWSFICSRVENKYSEMSESRGLEGGNALFLIKATRFL